jgi:hypothetical protein
VPSHQKSEVDFMQEERRVSQKREKKRTHTYGRLALTVSHLCEQVMAIMPATVLSFLRGMTSYREVLPRDKTNFARLGLVQTCFLSFSTKFRTLIFSQSHAPTMLKLNPAFRSSFLCMLPKYERIG